jgi:hypothetical protein
MDASDNRRKLWFCFWLLFIVTPSLFVISLFAGGNSTPGLPISILLVGSVITGFLLAKLSAKTFPGFVALGILYSAGVVVVYLGVAFVGCLVVGAAKSR